MKNRESRKREIIEKSFELIHRQGYNGTGIQELVDAAEIPKGSFYNYFKSKEEFTLEAISYLWEVRHKKFSQALTNKEFSPLTRIEKYYQEAIEEARQRKFALGCFLSNLCQELGDTNACITEYINGYFRKNEKILESCLREAQESGELSKAYSPETLASFLFNSWSGAILRMKGCKTEQPLNTFLTMLRHLFALPNI